MLTKHQVLLLKKNPSINDLFIKIPILVAEAVYKQTSKWVVFMVMSTCTHVMLLLEYVSVKRTWTRSISFQMDSCPHATAKRTISRSKLHL